VREVLMVFTKFPRPGSVKTRLGARIGFDEAARVFRMLAERTFAVAEQVRKTGREVMLFYAPGATENEMREWVRRDFIYLQQIGETLGGRMQAAFSHAFANGALRAVIIGTDVPDLDVETAQSAYNELNHTDVVLGPSTDGGYYLLGMNAPAKDVFTGITWSTDNVLNQTLDAVDNLNLRYTLLPSMSDIDTEEDYRVYLNATQKSK
jgi:rSAM/selenodomain-associated transferase 1